MGGVFAVVWGGKLGDKKINKTKYVMALGGRQTSN
jgi:hypothetical protein